MKFDRSEAKEKLAAVVLLTAAGAPYIYYGEELGFYGITKEGNGDQHVRVEVKLQNGGKLQGTLKSHSITGIVIECEEKVAVQTDFLCLCRKG